MNSLVSICIPVYNSEKTIQATIESILNQTYKELEIIIVDNCSTDSTWKIIDSFSDSRIRKFHNDTNIGMVRNWNKCLEYVTGKYIHFLCGDDILTPDCIEKKVVLADSDDDIALVFSSSQIINEKNEIVFVRSQFKKDCIINGKKLAKKSFCTKNFYGEPSNVLFRRDLLIKTGIFSDNLFYTLDWEMWLRLSVFGNVGFIKEVLMKYRIAKTNGTSKLKKSEIKNDDVLFIKNLENKGFHFSKLQIMRHRICIVFRMYARKIFMKLRS